MAHCFISYRRTPSAPLALLLQEKLKNQHKIDAYVDTTRTDSTRVQFPERLMQAIEDAPVFVCLLGYRDGQHTLESEWVLKEIIRAHELGKFCVPVFQESYTPIDNLPPAVDYLLSFDGVHIFDQKNVMMDESVARIANLIRPHIRTRRRFPLTALIAFLMLGMLGAVALAFLASNNFGAQTTPEPTTALAAIDNPTPTASRTQSPLQAATFTQTRDAEAENFQATVNAINTGTRAAIQALTPTVYIDPTLGFAVATQTQEAGVQATIDAINTGTRAAVLTMTAQPTATSTPSMTHTASATRTSTVTPTKTYVPTLSPEAKARTPVTSNDEWTPYERQIEGDLMMLVPVGCFDMGSDNADSPDPEKPLHPQCIDEPFWIDKYEVTNLQFGAHAQDCASYSSTDFQPRVCVKWRSAWAYCVERGGRLPTEREWEYAARGPDNLGFPWGQEFVSDNVVYKENSGNVTAAVGTLANGRSWVGAYDMSGNVWEWTSSLYFGYPYGADHEDDSNTNTLRVVRGGSISNEPALVRTTLRNAIHPESDHSDLGFRCARDVE